MTKKDYIQFAQLFKSADYLLTPKQERLYRFLLNGVVNIFKADSHRFDEVRFREAVGYETR